MPSVTVKVCEKACAAYKALRELSEDRDCLFLSLLCLQLWRPQLMCVG